MSNITKNHKVGIFAIFIASALMLGTISVSGIDSAFAGGSEHHQKNHDGKGKNSAEQAIEQTQVSKQDSQCTNSAFLVVSAADCNNLALQLNLNAGSNAIGQDE